MYICNVKINRLLNVVLVLDEYQKIFGDSWKAVQAYQSQPWPYLDEALNIFQVLVPHLFCFRVTIKKLTILCITYLYSNF